MSRQTAILPTRLWLNKNSYYGRPSFFIFTYEKKEQDRDNSYKKKTNKPVAVGLCTIPMEFLFDFVMAGARFEQNETKTWLDDHNSMSVLFRGN